MGLPYYLNVKRPEGLAAQIISNFIYLLNEGQEEEINYIIDYLILLILPNLLPTPTVIGEEEISYYMYTNVEIIIS